MLFSMVMVSVEAMVSVHRGSVANARMAAARHLVLLLFLALMFRVGRGTGRVSRFIAHLEIRMLSGHFVLLLHEFKGD